MAQFRITPINDMTFISQMNKASVGLFTGFYISLMLHQTFSQSSNCFTNIFIRAGTVGNFINALSCIIGSDTCVVFDKAFPKRIRLCEYNINTNYL